MAQFNGSSGDDIYTGGADNDTIVGNGGNDTLSGGGGDDLIVGGSGADVLDGGDGNDTIYSGLQSPPFNFPYYGNAYTPPVLDTGTERDTITGGAGSDTIFAGYGDSIDGGSGVDTLLISFLGATSGVTFDLHLSTQTIGGGTITGIETVAWVQGSNYADYIDASGGTGGYGEADLFGMGGDDTLIASYYTGVLDGGDGNDIVDGRGSQYLQAVYGGAGDDTLYANTNGFAVAWGGDGNDTINAGGEVHGGNGNDVITMLYSYYGARVYGDAGDDHIDAAPSGNTIAGGSGADVINGNSLGDVLGSADYSSNNTYGAPVFADDLGLEQDIIAGFGGDDTIAIGFGDSADGGVGTDRLRLSLAGSNIGLFLNTTGISSGQSVSLFGGTINSIENFEYLRLTEFNDNLIVATQGTMLTVNAGAGDDTVQSGSSSVTLDGGAGNDVFISGAAADTFDGGAGIDTIDYQFATTGVNIKMAAATVSTAGLGGDQFVNVENVFGTGFDDIIFGNEQANFLRGQDGNDTLAGGAGDDILEGGAGNDQLQGNAGADILRGGTGNDVYLIDGSDTVIENAGEGIDEIVVDTSYTLAANLEKLTLTGIGNVTGTGNAADNSILGNAGNNLLLGLDGNDQLTGGDGNDRLEGGNGNDILSGNDGDDILLGGAGADSFFGGSGIDTVSYVDASQGVTAYLNQGGSNAGGAAGDTIYNAENLTGSAFDDILVGDDTANVFVGGAGNDTIDGRGGIDTVDYSQESGTRGVWINLTENSFFEYDPTAPDGVGPEVDRHSARDSFNDVDTLTSIEHIITGNGDDVIFGSAATETFETGGGSDYLNSGGGGDTLIGGAGDDTYVVSAGDTIVELAGGGKDSVQTALATYVLSANVEDLYGTVTTGQTLTGNSLNNFIRAASGNDTLSGGAGDDTLAPGFGIDTMTGGTGNDTFQGAASHLNGDTITDFSVGDRIRITDVDISSFTFSLTGNKLTFSGNTQVPTTGSLTLTSVASVHLIATAAAEGGVQITIRPYHPHNDFNGDGISDILWRNDNGSFGDWLGTSTGGFANNGGNSSGSVSIDWHIAGTGDFNGDGRADILWRNNNGQMSDWLGKANGGFADNSGYSSTSVAVDWKVAGVGDFNGDGRSDILWRNDNGAIGSSLSNVNGGFAVLQGNGGVVPTSWKIAATGDFNGDGRDDILWRNDNGALSDWLGTASGGFANNDANASGFAPTNWHIVGTGDFNGDGRSDIMWRSDSGALSNWLGTTSGGFVNNDANASGYAPTSWQIAEIGDFNGDGRDDIMWRNDNGAFSNWLANNGGGFVNNDANAAGFVATSWHIQDPFIFGAATV